jgi:hypothetical protein
LISNEELTTKKCFFILKSVDWQEDGFGYCDSRGDLKAVAE